MQGLHRSVRGLMIAIVTGTLLAATASAEPFAYVTDRTSNTLSVIDTATTTVVATIPVGGFPLGVAVHPTGAFVYVVNGLDGTVSVIDTATNSEVLPRIAVGSGAGSAPNRVAANPSGAFVYVTLSSDNAVSVIDTATNQESTTIAVDTLPVGIAVHPAGTAAYVTSQVDDSVSMIDTATNAVVTTLQVGDLPVGVAVHPSGTAIYVANQNDDAVSVLDLRQFAAVAVGADPNSVAVGPLPPATAGVTAAGLAVPFNVTCANRATRQRVRAVSAAPEADCAGLGLDFGIGDRLSIRATGTAESASGP